ncbi:histidine phosphatase family protein [Caldilinea sp.]|uniref:histidine phosphatase family protein n=1 Tax=Caldilinea sp. TaxID=2293560 RepID=UPI002614541D|nr:histidine phosphatase family protein [Caldilinea sp.]
MTSSRPVTIYLARHATPDWNRKDIRYDVAPGPDLIPQGEQEAEKLGEFLRNAGVTRIIASPLVRTRRTAEIASAVAGIPVTVEEAVREYSREENDDVVFARFLPALEAAAALAGQEGPVAIVTHGGPIRVMLERFGADPDLLWHYRRQFDHQNPLPPAAAWELTRRCSDQPWGMRLAFAPTPFVEHSSVVSYV